MVIVNILYKIQDLHLGEKAMSNSTFKFLLGIIMVCLLIYTVGCQPSQERPYPSYIAKA